MVLTVYPCKGSMRNLHRLPSSYMHDIHDSGREKSIAVHYQKHEGFRALGSVPFWFVLNILTSIRCDTKFSQLLPSLPDQACFFFNFLISSYLLSLHRMRTMSLWTVNVGCFKNH